MKIVLQDWLANLSLKQQATLLTAVRNSDICPADHPSKLLIKWFRRSILIAASHGCALENPAHPGGGKFTGPCVECGSTLEQPTSFPDEKTHPYLYSMVNEDLAKLSKKYIKRVEELPMHYVLHFMHAVEILGYKHPNENIRLFWFNFYKDLVDEFHLSVETEEQLDTRLGDK